MTHPEGSADDYFSHERVTVIEPQKGWRVLDLRELWAYRELLFVLTLRDIKVRYKQTVLGFAWAIIQPVMLMVVFSIFFGRFAQIPSDGVPYPVFVYAALLPWTFFATAVTMAGNSLISSSHLVSKVYFPRLIIPLSIVMGGLVDFLISSAILILLLFLYGIPLTAKILMAPLFVVGIIFTALGAGTFLSALTVAYRDFRYVVPILIQFWLFATPVVYPASIVPAKWHWLLYINPMAGIVAGFRSTFLGQPINLVSVAISTVVAVLIFVCGVAYFEKVERRFADII